MHQTMNMDTYGAQRHQGSQGRRMNAQRSSRGQGQPNFQGRNSGSMSFRSFERLFHSPATATLLSLAVLGAAWYGLAQAASHPIATAIAVCAGLGVANEMKRTKRRNMLRSREGHCGQPAERHGNRNQGWRAQRDQHIRHAGKTNTGAFSATKGGQPRKDAKQRLAEMRPMWETSYECRKSMTGPDETTYECVLTATTPNGNVRTFRSPGDYTCKLHAERKAAREAIKAIRMQMQAQKTPQRQHQNRGNDFDSGSDTERQEWRQDQDQHQGHGPRGPNGRGFQGFGGGKGKGKGKGKGRFGGAKIRARQPQEWRQFRDEFIRNPHRTSSGGPVPAWAQECKFFRTRGGCNAGKRCSFAHNWE